MLNDEVIKLSLTLPIEFKNRMKALLKEEWPDFLKCYENDRYQALRINGLKKPSPKDLVMKAFDLHDKVPWESNGFYYSEDARPGKDPFHEMGLYYIQEPSAMSAAVLLAPEPGMRILDLCAAPGGKSTQLASALAGRGLLLANEINPQRAKILSSNIERMGIKNCLVTSADSEKLSSSFPGFFHGILADSPCSGEGMFRKNSGAISEWSPDNVRLCAARSLEILDNASKMLAPGGRLVYSTCTFAPEENEDTINTFLREHPDFYLEKADAPWFSKARPDWVLSKPAEGADLSQAFRLWPHHLHGEGHFAAVLRRRGVLAFLACTDKAPVPDVTDAVPDPDPAKKDAEKKKEKGKNQKNRKGKEDRQSLMSPEEKKTFDDFWQQTFREDLNAEERSRLKRRGDQLYLIPKDCPSDADLAGISVLRQGLHLGELKKMRFEPALALALSVSMKDVFFAADLKTGDKRIPAFYRGESFSLSENDFAGDPPKSGWLLLCLEGYPCGWGKFTGGTFKNHYPKGLRKQL